MNESYVIDGYVDIDVISISQKFFSSSRFRLNVGRLNTRDEGGGGGSLQCVR